MALVHANAGQRRSPVIRWLQITAIAAGSRGRVTRASTPDHRHPTGSAADQDASDGQGAAAEVSEHRGNEPPPQPEAAKDEVCCTSEAGGAGRAQGA